MSPPLGNSFSRISMTTRLRRSPTTRIALVTSACFLALSGCMGESSSAKVPEILANGDLDHSALSPVNVAGEIVASGTMFGRIGPMASDSTTLWIADISGDPFLHIVSIAHPEQVVSRGRRGSGPGEFRAIAALFRSGTSAGGRTWAFDPTVGSLTELRTDDATRGTAPTVINLPTGPRPRRVISLGSGFLGWTADSSVRFVLIDSVGQRTGTAGGALLGSDSIPFPERMKASSTLSMCSKSDGSRFVIAYLGAGRADVYDDAAQYLTSLDVPFPSNGDFVKAGDGTLGWARARGYYAACSATPQHVYLLFSGKEERVSPDGGSRADLDLGSHVHVFDWSGKLVKVIALDQDVGGISVTPDETLIFASGASSGTILRYRIK